ncbi:axial regulator YABBY 5-like isoform X1 [Musa acuminata AAA Group]|uniref:axial regulator YABBY 5-like isoform X1 n=1 Tax=Musa acuminata AAA Group TaxID=214697 RepID=UPI0031CF68B9
MLIYSHSSSLFLPKASLVAYAQPAGDRRSMSTQQVCYVHCSFCNTILVVNIPCNNLFDNVTVQCENCANMLSVNFGAQFQRLPLQDIQHHSIGSQGLHRDCGSSSSKCAGIDTMNSTKSIKQQMLRVRTAAAAAGKRRRVPSVYNRFIKEEIRRLKARNPDISHREAFSTAAKNWAHLPRIHFGQSVEGNQQLW